MKIRLLLLSIMMILGACKSVQPGSQIESVIGDLGGQFVVIQYESKSETFQVRRCTEDEFAAAIDLDSTEVELDLNDCSDKMGYDPIPTGLYKALLGAKVGYRDLSVEEGRLRNLYWSLDRQLRNFAGDDSSNQDQALPQAEVSEDFLDLAELDQLANKLDATINKSGKLNQALLDKLEKVEMPEEAKKVAMSLKAKIDALEELRARYYGPNYTFRAILGHLMPYAGEKERYKVVPPNRKSYQLAIFPFEEVKRAGGMQKFMDIAQNYKWSSPSDLLTLPAALKECAGQGMRLPSSIELTTYYVNQKNAAWGRYRGQVAYYWVNDNLTLSSDKLLAEAMLAAPAAGDMKTRMLTMQELEKGELEGKDARGQVICVDGGGKGEDPNGDQLFKQVQDATYAKWRADLTNSRDQIRDKKQEIAKLIAMKAEAEEQLAKAKGSSETAKPLVDKTYQQYLRYKRSDQGDSLRAKWEQAKEIYERIRQAIPKLETAVTQLGAAIPAAQAALKVTEEEMRNLPLPPGATHDEYLQGTEAKIDQNQSSDQSGEICSCQMGRCNGANRNCCGWWHHENKRFYGTYYYTQRNTKEECSQWCKNDSKLRNKPSDCR